MPKPFPVIDYTRAALLKAQGLKNREIAEQLGCKLNSLMVGMSRKGITKLAVEARKGLVKAAQHTADAIEASGGRTRNHFAKVIESSAESLASDLPVKRKELANTKDGQGTASVVKTLVEAAAKVYGWDEQGSGGSPVNVLFLSYQPETEP